MDQKISGLNHLFMTVFLYSFAAVMVAPAITDVTLSALCPGKDECSFVIYLSGAQQAIIGVGTLVLMPLLGNLSDAYGRKVMLTVPMTLTIFPLAILAYSRTKYFFYAYYVIRTLTAMVCDGSAQCIALAYVADNVPENRRASAFGILSGISSAAFVCGNLSTRFLTTACTFQVSAVMAVVALVYMRIFLAESNPEGFSARQKETECLLNRTSSRSIKLFKTLPSWDDTISLFRSSQTFSQAVVVAFFITLGDLGLFSSLLYYLKAQFHFNKDQFADLMVISGIAGTLSQMLLMPILVPAIGEEKLLAVGLLFSCVNMVLYSIAWSSWVPYAAALFSVLTVFAGPSLRSIVSKQVGPNEQGKVQGCFTGICSFASIISPLAFSPLTALFLSENAPFHFPGFSIICAGFFMMIAFIQSVMIRPTPSISTCRMGNSNCAEP